MIPSSRPKLSDLYTLSQSKMLENHTLHSSKPIIDHLWRNPPPREICRYLPYEYIVMCQHFDTKMMMGSCLNF